MATRAKEEDVQVLEEGGSVVEVALTSRDQTIGGDTGHYLRRVYHVIMFLAVPFLYYFALDELASSDSQRAKILSLCACLFVIAEAARLYFGIVFTGFRQYEKTHLSAQVYGSVGVCLVMLASPVRGTSREAQMFISAPIIWCLALADPLIGELKQRGYSLRERSMVAVVVCYVVWVASLLWLGNGNTLAIICTVIMPPIAVAAEYPSIANIDDNGMMLLVPLVVALLLNPWQY